MRDKLDPADPALRGYEASGRGYAETRLHLWVSACLDDGLQELDTMIVTAPASLKSAFCCYDFMADEIEVVVPTHLVGDCGQADAGRPLISHQAYHWDFSLRSRSAALVGATLEKAAVHQGLLADKSASAYLGRMQRPAFPLPHQMGS